MKKIQVKLENLECRKFPLDTVHHRVSGRNLNFVFLRSNNGGSKERFITAQKRRFRRQNNDSELDSGTNEEKEAELEHQLQIFSDKL